MGVNLPNFSLNTSLLMPSASMKFTLDHSIFQKYDKIDNCIESIPSLSILAILGQSYLASVCSFCSRQTLAGTPGIFEWACSLIQELTTRGSHLSGSTTTPRNFDCVLALFSVPAAFENQVKEKRATRIDTEQSP